MPSRQKCGRRSGWWNAAGSDERLALARTAGERVNAYVGPEIHDRHSVTFSLGNVIIHSVSAALEMSDQTKALRLNREADPAHIAVLPNSCLGHHHMDLARAWLWDGNRDQALTELETAERIASSATTQSRGPRCGRSSMSSGLPPASGCAA